MTAIAKRFEKVRAKWTEFNLWPENYVLQLPPRYEVKILEVALTQDVIAGDFDTMVEKMCPLADEELRPIFDIEDPCAKAVNSDTLQTFVRTFVHNRWEGLVPKGEAAIQDLEKFCLVVLDHHRTMKWAQFDTRGVVAALGFIQGDASVSGPIDEWLGKKNEVVTFVSNSAAWELRKAKLSDAVTARDVRRQVAN